MSTALTTRNENQITVPNGQMAETGTRAPRVWSTAAVDVLEGPDEYLVFADVPGVQQEDLHIEFSDGELRLYAERQGETGSWPDAYRRSFQVGRGVDADRISAELTRGVVQVHLPKLESARSRRIPVQTD
jgi:HSP20 family molecular chaperone IbpA